MRQKLEDFKLFVALLFLCCIFSCSRDEKLEYSIEIHNQDLVEAITEYQSMIYSEFKKNIESGDSVYLSMIIRQERSFSILSDNAYYKYSKILFPKEYEENPKGKFLDLCQPTDCYLTFLGDSLIDKTYKCGGPRDKVLVKLNGKEVYL